MTDETCPTCGQALRHKGRPRAITEEKLKAALRLHKGVTEIAEEEGCSRGAIYNAIRRFNLKCAKSRHFASRDGRASKA